LLVIRNEAAVVERDAQLFDSYRRRDRGLGCGYRLRHINIVYKEYMVLQKPFLGLVFSLDQTDDYS
jgi:hypothetical protein